MDTNDVLVSFNHSLQRLSVLGHAHPMTVCDVSSQDAFNRSIVEVDKNLAWEFCFLKFPYSRFWAFLSRAEICEVLCYVDSQELKTAHLLHLSSTDVNRFVCLCLLFF